ncbi:MAG: hypothetical protein M1834_007451 [Cirrosporium novae-zelandiae]|nr:MAG: hypothetical protein M1834_007451 [Cirrosporium novae-zelandiae]
MKTFIPTISLSLAAVAQAAGVIYLAGDSTMASGGGGDGTQGWGEYLQYSVNLTVSNEAVAGRSARSFTREGRFDAIAEEIAEGDFVVIEFGHNDGGSFDADDDNGRTDCPGEGNETCSTVYDGVSETVLTFSAYYQNAANMFYDLGATVILSGPTPNNPWETGTFEFSTSRFTTYAEDSAEETCSDFVDHGQYVANEFETLGATTVDDYYPNDHTHTSPEGADVVAAAFVKGILCSSSSLKDYIINSTDTVSGSCV